MIGYYEVPLYSDATLSEVVNHLYIPVISREAADHNRTFTYTTYQGDNVTSYFGGRGKWGTAATKSRIYYGDLGIYNNGGSTSVRSTLPNSVSSFSGIKMTSRAHISELMFPGAHGEDQLTNKFNFARLAYLALDENQPISLYLSNGNYLTVYKEETENDLYGRINLFRSNGNRINPNPMTVILGLKSRSGSFSAFNVLLSVRGMQGVMETFGKTLGYCSYMHTYFFYDDYTDLSLWDCQPYLCNISISQVTSSSPSDLRKIYGVGTWITYSGLGSNSINITMTNFCNFLGITSVSNIEPAIEQLNGKYKENTEDVDNTYPGGGEDKNTYPEDGESGKGTFDNTNDEVGFPTMPLWDATSTGFISMWNPTITEITSLYGFLWDSDISTTLKKLFLEPMDAIISLSFFPVDPINFPEKRNVTIGHVDTEIQMYAVQKQFVDFDFGTLKIDEYYGAAWDYSPYTQASIYLPYIGTQALDIDDVMNGTLHLKYRVDLLSGMCAAMLRVDRSRDGLQAVIYTWQGNCAMQVPITAGSARDFLNSIIQLGAMAGVSLAQPLAGAIDASMHKGEENYQGPIMGNNWINPTIATFSALNVIGQKVRVQRGGRVDANAGVMSPQEAYIILNRPVSAIPKGWNEYAGYPSLKVKTLSTQKGYTEIAYIKLNGLEATSDEIMELDGMLKGGVIL